MGIWNDVSKVTTPTWSLSTSVTTPSWSQVTINNSITYKGNTDPTPSIDVVNGWNLITDNWEHFSYEWEDLII